MKVLLFAGTTEGRLLAERFSTLPDVQVTVCVATEYGRELLTDLPEHVTVLAQRLDTAAMASLMRHGGFDLVVDATHPYATEVTKNITAAAIAAGREKLRLVRGASDAGHFHTVRSVPAAAEALCQTEGNVLITTGSKELSAYTMIPDFATRLYPRVLPTVEAIETCAKLGFASRHMIAMQGPFSLELNRAVMQQFAIRWLVTKDGGAQGGFAQKIEAALLQKVNVLVVGRPVREAGNTMDEIVDMVQRKREVSR